MLDGVIYIYTWNCVWCWNLNFSNSGGVILDVFRCYLFLVIV
jgi:hypothetical protein